jgi:hypothetical protein
MLKYKCIDRDINYSCMLNRAVIIVQTMCKHWDLRCINKNSITSGKPWLENGELIYINLSFLF